MRIPSGAVLPSSIVGVDSVSEGSAFQRTYNNTTLRAGIVIRSYDVGDEKNRTKLVPEYDVVVIEQDQNRAIAPITYRNCLSASSFGSIADYFESRLRSQNKVVNKASQGKDFNGQDGATVLLLCLDGAGEKAIIIGALPHPDRKSKLTGSNKVLAGEFNGLSISVDNDGAANLTFNGATDNSGKPLDASQGVTRIDIEKDGTLAFTNKGVSFRMEKMGNVLLSNEGTLTVSSKKDISVKTEQNMSAESTKNAALKMKELLIEASGSAKASAQSFMLSADTKFDLQAQMVQISGDAEVKIKSTMITLEGLTFVGGPGGQPIVLPTTQMIGTGNQGLPVVSTAIGPFATKAFAL